MVFAGCASAPLRQSTLALESETESQSAIETDLPGLEAPVVLQTVEPQHPWQLARLGIPGEVSLNLVIDETGKVTETQVVSSTDPVFEQPAITAVKKWTFKPASQNGVPVRARANVPILFGFKD